MYADGPLRPVNQIPDFVGYLHDCYQQWLKEEAKQKNKEPKSGTLKGFMKFARMFLAKNPPANPLYLAAGLGVRMANGDYVALGVPQDTPRMRDEGVHITMPQSIPGMHGINDTSGISVLGSR
jgi:hypothetical protein